MKFLTPVLILVSLFCSFVRSQDRPLFTESADTIDKGKFRFEFGAAYLKEVKYTTSGLGGNLFRLGDLGARFGAGEKVEIELFWTVQNFLSITDRWEAPLSERIEFTGNSTNDIGDLTIATKINLLKENEARPGIGFRFGTQLPNASQESGLGADEVNFFITALLEKNFGQFRLIGNAGLSILGDPTNIASQNDLYNYSVAAILPIVSGFEAFVDVYGRAGTAGIGTEEQTRLRTGGQLKTAGIFWDFGMLFGFQDTDPHYGFIFGLSKEF